MVQIQRPGQGLKFLGNPAVTASQFPGGELTYLQKLVQTYAASEVWALDDLSGTTAVAAVNTARNGTYTGVALNDADGPVTNEAERAGRWDGTNDYCNFNTASYQSLFNGAEGSVFAWAKVAAASVWTDANIREIFRSLAGASNFIILRKSSTNNTLEWFYNAGGASKTTTTNFSGTDWFSMGLSWSKSADQVKWYLNGAQVGATVTGLGVWAGTPVTNLFGASATTPSTVWNGWLMYEAVKFGGVWSATDFANMHDEVS